MNIRIQHSKVSETVSKLQEIYKSRLEQEGEKHLSEICLLYTSPSPRDCS